MAPDRSSAATELQRALQGTALALFGVAEPRPADPCPPDTRTIALLGPREPGFWDHVTASPEFADEGPNPLDRWSKRVIGALAATLGGAAMFPSDGPPYPPFQRWARDSGRAWDSPVGLLVHDVAGLMVSYRGAIALPFELECHPSANPCNSCATRPCLAACPADAMGQDRPYDLHACHSHLDTSAGRDCMEAGCAVRRACPVSQRYGRQADQSAFHMRAFHEAT